jgi:hypothetical protein
MLGVEIPDGLVYGVAPVLITLWAALFAWTLLLIYKTTLMVAVHEQRIQQLERDMGSRLQFPTRDTQSG